MDSTGDGIRLEQISVGEILELAQLSIMKKVASDEVDWNESSNSVKKYEWKPNECS